MMKKLVIAFAFILMIAGGTISVLKWLEIGPFAPNGEVDVVDQVDPGEPPRFIDMDPLSIPIFQGDKVAATIQIQFMLEAVGADNEAKITRLLPRLGDAFLRDLYSFIPRLLKKEERISVVIIKQRLQMIADEVTGPGIIDDILVQSVVDIPGGR